MSSLDDEFPPFYCTLPWEPFCPTVSPLGGVRATCCGLQYGNSGRRSGVGNRQPGGKTARRDLSDFGFTVIKVFTSG